MITKTKAPHQMGLFVLSSLSTNHNVPAASNNGLRAGTLATNPCSRLTVYKNRSATSGVNNHTTMATR
nr:MAG TPA: hypothetical protein [Caudoviricetes sp.]